MITHARVGKIVEIKDISGIPEDEIMVLKGKTFQILMDNTIELTPGLLVAQEEDSSIEYNFNYDKTCEFKKLLEEELENKGIL